MTIFVDFASAGCRLAVGPTLAMVAEIGLVPEWRPCPFPQRSNVTRGSSRGARHAEARADYRAREAAFYADAQGIVLQPPAGSALPANAALLWANRAGAGAAWVQNAFPAIWSGELDGDDAPAVAAALAELCDAEGFVEFVRDEAEALLEAAQSEAVEQGVVNVPAFVVAEELFIGREHLPLLRWLLEGAEGQPPV